MDQVITCPACGRRVVPYDGVCGACKTDIRAYMPRSPEEIAREKRTAFFSTFASARSSSTQKWEYVIADFVLLRTGWMLVSINGKPLPSELYGIDIQELVANMGEHGWEMVNTTMGREAWEKRWKSLAELVSGNTHEPVDVFVVSFKRPKD